MRTPVRLPASEILNKTLESLLHPVIVVDATGTIIKLNPAAKKGLGGSPPSTLRDLKERLQLYRPDGGTRFPPDEGPLARALKGEAVLNLEMLVRSEESPEGRRFLASGHPIRNSDGTVAGAVSVFHDITALHLAEDRLRSLVGAMSEGIFVVDATTGRFIEVNESGATMYGYTPEEMIGLDIESISSNLPPYTQKDALVWIGKAATTGRPQHFDWQSKRKDGRLIWVEVSIKFASIGGRDVILSIVRDVTERRTMEAQLRQALKMEAIGTLAGGVAHELNNLLQPIIMMTELVISQLPEGNKHADHLNSVIEAGARAAEIVQRILAFVRVDEASHSPLDLRSVVREAIGFIRTILPTSITLHVDIDDAVITVRGDRTQLIQVLINLATNARDAIGADVGKVWISLAKADATGPAGSAEQGRYAVFKITDTGVGMDQATMQRIFEPFFTTKGVGRGTGLGLSVTHGIVTGLGGSIQVESAPGRGTTFSLYLPIVEGEMALALTG